MGPCCIVCNALNIVCTFYAGMVNIKAITSHAQEDLLSIASLAAISIHFMVALWLYMGSKLFLTQKKQLGQTIVLVLIGMIDAAAVAMGLLLVHSLSSPSLQTLWHSPIEYKDHTSKIPSYLQTFASLWFVMLCIMLTMQLLTAVLRGWELKSVGAGPRASGAPAPVD